MCQQPDCLPYAKARSSSGLAWKVLEQGDGGSAAPARMILIRLRVHDLCWIAQTFATFCQARNLPRLATGQRKTAGRCWLRRCSSTKGCCIYQF